MTPADPGSDDAVVRPLRPYVALPDDEPATSPGAVGSAGEPVRRSLAVRPFLVTAGRVTDEQRLPLETQVVATAEGLAALPTLTFEEHDIVAACGEPLSLAEIAARLHLHLNVVRVLAGDLRISRQLTVHAPQAGTAHDLSVLRRVIEGLRAVPDSRGLTRDNDRPA
ncbi:Protein of unknown function [Streptacidiphilus jiangxiensis]|uniref:Multi-component regulatory system-4 n=1 Tax=Streptacidiphilus jiangxiensis TaxID=235985 RepID=A0A1H7K169_STRJI|nr:Protein of unknown function [Streptacidiphilus jiangxiensis]